METVGVAIIARNVEKTIDECIESFIHHVDQCVVVMAGESTDKTQEILEDIQGIYPEVLQIEKFDWIDDFAAARNYSFSFMKTDWILWVDADDIVIQANLLREMVNNTAPEFGAIWFQYYYSCDEFGNITTLYERERLLRRKCSWIWKGRLHETASPMVNTKYIRDNRIVIKHNHLAGEQRANRNFKILHLMEKESPEDKRVLLYLGHQHFAVGEWMKSAEYYLKFATDKQCMPIERYQAYCYCSKALREMSDPQCIDVANAAISLLPEYKDGYIEAAYSYDRFNQPDKAIFYADMVKDYNRIQDAPSVIFINPLEYEYGVIAILAESYWKKGDYKKSQDYLKEAYKIRPVNEIQERIIGASEIIMRERVDDSIKTLAVHLNQNKEMSKLPALLAAIPFWWRDSDEYLNLKSGIEQQMSELNAKADVIESEDGKSVSVNLGNDANPINTLAELDAKYERVTVVCPYPSANVEQINVYSQSDMEYFLICGDNRRVIRLNSYPSNIVCEYDHQIPTATVRFFVGQGLENWNPRTIKEIGCGGSETAVAMVAKYMAQELIQPIVYAMDNEAWDGVIYRWANKYRDNVECDLLISSRQPQVLANESAAKKKFLWVHDISCFERLTPQIAENLDAIICLSHWHVDFMKRTYPWLSLCNVIDLDDQDKTYEDLWTPAKYYENEKLNKLPIMAIVGNGLETERFETWDMGNKIENRFIWCSSPDRGLEQLLAMWKLIREKLPDAELKIFYGWEYFDSSLMYPGQRELKEKIREMIKQPGVEWCGRIGQQALAGELEKAFAMIYPPPHDFRETYGIAFLEAQAMGVIPFYRMNGALGETIGNRGVPLELDMTQPAIVDRIVSVLGDRKFCSKIRIEGRKYAMRRTWREQTNKILRLWKDEY